MIDILLKEIMYVRLTFPDSSVQVICTTLNKEILSKIGVELRENFFYDLEKEMYVKFNYEAIEADLIDSKNVLSGVAQFANRFI